MKLQAEYINIHNQYDVEKEKLDQLRQQKLDKQKEDRLLQERRINKSLSR